MIKKVGSSWVVYTHDGSRVLGKHPSREQALAQLRAVEASKHKKGKK